MLLLLYSMTGFDAVKPFSSLCPFCSFLAFQNVLLQVETEEEVAEWLSSIELQQRKPSSPKMPEKAAKPGKTAKPKPSKDTQLGKQDKKAFDEVAVRE